ncbi:hypothetical protein [Saccharothrix australiensis]|uniref:Uncharacterized protein n=1 Tax=Saccharothrix australiensis TaxID=2072 RepID=A0A495VU69_9PSEU|nr:hypothetical protein [Saccharothrix australiensis]RKT51975.1 hypothetical protein C8E97_0466 [Saccharothrix australiensis]
MPLRRNRGNPNGLGGRPRRRLKERSSTLTTGSGLPDYGYAGGGGRSATDTRFPGAHGDATVVASVYTTSDDPTAVLGAVRKLVNGLGLKFRADGPVETGSWFRRFRIRGQKSVLPKLEKLAGQLEEAARLHYIDGARAQNDEREANAVSNLISALDNTEGAVIRLSSILVVKSRGVVMVQVLTPDQAALINRNPHLLKSPDTILEELSLGTRAALEENPKSQVEVPPSNH